MFREQRFRINLVTFGLFLSALIVVVVEFERAVQHVRPHLWQDGPRALLFLLAMWVLALVCWAAFPGYAGPDGIRATDGIGRYHDVPWNEITSISSFLGFLWIRHGKPGKALSFPKFLEDYQSFRQYVVAHAPEGNPLRTFL